MRLTGAALFLLLPVVAVVQPGQAQRAPIPLLPPSVQYPPPSTLPPESSPPQQPLSQQPLTQPPPAAPEQPQWLPRAGAVIQALDKINTEVAVLKLKDGETGQFGSLTIMVKACVVRPPDVPQDAAALLSVTDSHPGQQGFEGWMLKAEPSVSMLQNPIYDLRVMGCIS
jgi:hypothetical protein